MNNTGIIILAAGSSSRLGIIKQLLKYKNNYLLQHVIDEAINAKLCPVIVVTGAYTEEIIHAIQFKNVTIVYNSQWQQGMASGIVAGLSNLLLTDQKIENVILSVCDQPLISSTIFIQLYNKAKATGANIIASKYANTIGTPVLFTKKYYKDLLNLKGEEGAKKLLKIFNNDISTIDFIDGNLDVDTMEDYEQLLMYYPNHSC